MKRQINKKRAFILLAIIFTAILIPLGLGTIFFVVWDIEYPLVIHNLLDVSMIWLSGMILIGFLAVVLAGIGLVILIFYNIYSWVSS